MESQEEANAVITVMMSAASYSSSNRTSSQRLSGTTVL